jgi:predicted lysophospholipase L1 biosynthesis ABC-type transport system permease subunit
MTSLVRALTGTDKGTHDFVAAILILVGGLLIIGSYVYLVFVQPEWTFEEATLALWPFFTAGGVSLAGGWLVDRTGDGSHKLRQEARNPPTDQ